MEDNRTTKRRRSRFSAEPVTRQNQKQNIESVGSVTNSSNKNTSISSSVPSTGMDNTVSQPLATTNKSSARVSTGASDLERIKHAAALQAHVQQQMEAVQQALASKTNASVSSSFMSRFSAVPAQSENRRKRARLEGVDETGKLIDTTENEKAKAKKRQNPYLAHREEDAAVPSSTVQSAQKSNLINNTDTNSGVEQQSVTALTEDPRIRTSNRNLRRQRGLQFIERGTYERQGDEMRERAEFSAMLAAKRASGTAARPSRVKDDLFVRSQDSAPIDNAPKLPPRVELQTPPDMEWWDAAFLPVSKRKERANLLAQAQAGKGQTVKNGYDELAVRNAKTYAYVEHPVPIQSASDMTAAKALPLMLTKKERKRLRRQRRAERQKEIQDKVALGLMAPPEPKAKLSNLMRVLGDQAVADPSQVEKKVRQQMGMRVKNHSMRNLAKKLTPEERKEKHKQKMTQDVTGSGGIHVAVFRVRDLSNPRHRFKVDANARESYLSGIALMCRDPQLCMVVVEGGPRAIKRYIRLMTHRIKWKGEEEDEEDEYDSEEEEESTQDTSNMCDLVWRGIIPSRTFNGFRFEECRTVVSARRAMENRNVAHYWDMTLQGAKGLDPAEIRGIETAATAVDVAVRQSKVEADLSFLDE